MKLFSFLVAVAAVAVLAFAGAGMAAYQVTYNFEAGWAGDYHPDWQNSDYRHGEPPVGKMMQQVDLTAYGRPGNNGLKLIADSAPEDWMWWAIVEVKDEKVASGAMDKGYNPYLQVDYYDPGTPASGPQATGQLYALPSWVNPYINGSEDWTDVQFGARFNQYDPTDQYYYVAAGEASPGWVTTGLDREEGWHTLRMQLLASDGRIHFSIDGVEYGQSYRNDYIDLEGVSLATMFTPPLGGWTDKPYTIWDDYTFGSDLPEPASLVVWGLLAAVGAVIAWRRRAA